MTETNMYNQLSLVFFFFFFPFDKVYLCNRGISVPANNLGK